VSAVPGYHLAWSSKARNTYRATEGQLQYIGRSQRPEGRVPVLFLHGFNLSGDIAGFHRAPAYNDDFRAIAGSTYPVIVFDAGGGSTWGNDDVVAASGAIDDLLTFVATDPNLLVDTSKVALFAESMGTLNALNWAWRNPGKVRAMVLRAPIVAMEAFRTRNAATFGAVMDAAYGGSIDSAEYDAHDPMRNIDLIRPFGDRILLWYATSDEYIPPAEVEAFAELVGATAIEVPGNHADTVNTRVDKTAMWLIEQIRHRRRAVVDWQPSDWSRFDHYNLTPDTGANVNVLDTAVGNGGRRGQYNRVSGTDGNQREALVLREILTPDHRIEATWFQDNGGPVVGQHGLIGRFVVDDAGIYKLYITWSNILFGVPWIINQAVWTGTVGVNNLTIQGLVGATVPGLRLAAGGEILASSRSSNVVTLVIHAEDAKNFTGIIDVVMAGAIGNGGGVATLVDDTHIQYTQAGPDVVSGGPGSWADFNSAFPYEAEIEVTGVPAVMRARFWIPGTERPVWGDPDWTLTWNDSGGWGHTGYGSPGHMFGHVGINSPGQPVKIQVGRTAVDEL
jgi:pimeloyl-ACP methyl ester carboxylesterase